MTKLNFICLTIAGCWLLVTACAREQNSSTIDVYDSFETTSLGWLWDTDRFEPGAVTMQTNIVRAGHGAAKITVHTKDKFEAGSPGTSGSERDELREANKLTSRENVPYEFSFSLFFPTNFPVVPTRLVIAQWKQYCANGGNCSDDSPVLAVRYIAGELRITQDLDKQFIMLYRETNEFRGRWLDFKFQVRFSPKKENGRIKAWLGDKQLVDYQGVTADSENGETGYPSPSRFYFKMGLYRNVMAEPMTVYIDEYRKKEMVEGSF